MVNGKTHRLHSRSDNQKKSNSRSLHPRNIHHGRYDFVQLTQALPELKHFQTLNPKGEPTIDFADSQAVIALNKALLAHHYGVMLWDLPAGYLCPPIPGRADYIHYLADLLANDTNNIPTGKNVHALDIGTGANCIYPIIGSQSYGWKFTATDIDPVSVNTAKTICAANANLKPLIRVKQQKQPEHIFHGVIGKDDFFDVTLCNPPFHASLDDAMAANARKQHNLKRHQKKRHPQKRYQAKQERRNSVSAKANAQNFGGQQAELWCEGGEIAFLKRMAHESKDFAEQVGWFTSLVSKSENVKPLEQTLKKLGVANMRIIPMHHGQKVTRVMAWTY